MSQSHMLQSVLIIKIIFKKLDILGWYDLTLHEKLIHIVFYEKDPGWHDSTLHAKLPSENYKSHRKLRTTCQTKAKRKKNKGIGFRV